MHREGVQHDLPLWRGFETNRRCTKQRRQCSDQVRTIWAMNIAQHALIQTTLHSRVLAVKVGDVWPPGQTSFLRCARLTCRTERLAPRCVNNHYACRVSPCRLISRPSISTSLLTRSP